MTCYTNRMTTRKREASIGPMEKTYNVGTDLTTEDCVLGDHDCGFSINDEEVV